MAVIGLGVFYVLVSWLVIAGNGADQAVAVSRGSTGNSFDVFLDLTRANLGGPSEKIYEILACTGSFACAMAFHNAASRYLYAFGREVDDVADEPGTVEAKLAGLAAWREEVERLYAGRPTRPTTRALLEPVRRFDLPRQEFELLIEGMEMDARGMATAPSRARGGRCCAVGGVCLHRRVARRSRRARHAASRGGPPAARARTRPRHHATAGRARVGDRLGQASVPRA